MSPARRLPTSHCCRNVSLTRSTELKTRGSDRPRPGTSASGPSGTLVGFAYQKAVPAASAMSLRRPTRRRHRRGVMLRRHPQPPNVPGSIELAGLGGQPGCPTAWSSRPNGGDAVSDRSGDVVDVQRSSDRLADPLRPRRRRSRRVGGPWARGGGGTGAGGGTVGLSVRCSMALKTRGLGSGQHAALHPGRGFADRGAAPAGSATTPWKGGGGDVGASSSDGPARSSLSSSGCRTPTGAGAAGAEEGPAAR